MNPFNFAGPFAGSFAGMNKANGALSAMQQKQTAFLSSLSPFFQVTTVSILRRLSMIVFPYMMWASQTESLPLDLYLPVVGEFAYSIAIAFREVTQSSTVSPFILTSALLVSLLVLVAEALVVKLVARMIGLEIQILEVFALALYKALLAAVLVMCCFVPILYWIMLVVLSTGIAVHNGRCGMTYVKSSMFGSSGMYSPKSNGVRSAFIVIWAMVQPVLLFLLTFNWTRPRLPQPVEKL